MKNPCTKLSSILVAAISLLFISAVSARAQQQPRVPAPPPPERALAPRVMTRESLEWEYRQRIRGVNEPNNNTRFDDYRARRRVIQAATVAQVKQDTERIQFFNTEMMRSVSTGAPLDYDHIVKTTGEIKTRAARLMLNLNLPKLEKSEKAQTGPELFDNPALVASLKKLDELVKNFSANPLPSLGNVGVLDVKAVTNARQNLADIIMLSDRISKSARRLRQAARQKP